jgi:hypothetical protein
MHHERYGSERQPDSLNSNHRYVVLAVRRLDWLYNRNAVLAELQVPVLKID